MFESSRERADARAVNALLVNVLAGRRERASGCEEEKEESIDDINTPEDLLRLLEMEAHE